MLPTDANTIFGEGLSIPPLKLFERGEVNEDVLDLILNNMRMPEMNYSDLFAIIAGCRAGEKRVIEICDRFGGIPTSRPVRRCSIAPTARCAS